MDPVALALLQRYPMPTSAGTANNYKRTDNEIDNQEQGDIRIDHRFDGNRDRLFGRLTYFHDNFMPVTPLPEGSGTTSGTLGPQDTKAWSFASNYQHVFSDRLLNEVRIGDTRRTVGRSAAQLAAVGRRPRWHPRHSVLRAVSRTRCRLSRSAATSSSDRRRTRRPISAPSVTEVADSLSWLKGRTR